MDTEVYSSLLWDSRKHPVLFFPLETGKWILKLVYLPSLSSPSLSGTHISLFQTQENAKPAASSHRKTPQLLQPISLCLWVPAQGSGCLRPHVPLSGGWVSWGIHPCHLQSCPTSMGEGSQFRSKHHPSQEDLSLSSILTSSTSCPSKAFPNLISAQPGLGWVTKVTPFPSQLPVPLPEWTSWAGFFIQLRRWLPVSPSPSYLTLLQEAVS